MILSGSIERFDLASVLQFLAQNTATGILAIQDYEEHGRVYMVKGRVEAISLPQTDDRLGIFLLKHGVVTEGQLARVLMEEAGVAEGNETLKPVGQRLAERGFVPESIIRQAMYRLTVSRVFELTHWRSGTFSYDEPEQMPHFQIAINAEVQELLLNAQVRIDHGEKPRKRVAAKPVNEVCAGCTVADCSPAVKLKYMRKDMCLWRKMSSAPEVRPDKVAGILVSASRDPYAEDAKAEAAMERQWG